MASQLAGNNTDNNDQEDEEEEEDSDYVPGEESDDDDEDEDEEEEEDDEELETEEDDIPEPTGEQYFVEDDNIFNINMNMTDQPIAPPPPALVQVFNYMEEQNQDPSFNPEENSPSRVPRAPTVASTGIGKDMAFQHLDSIPDSITDNDEKIALAKSELKKVAKKIMGVIDGAPCSLIFGFQIYTGDVYSVTNWIDEIKMLLNYKYNGGESSVEQGTEISRLAIRLQNED